MENRLQATREEAGRHQKAIAIFEVSVEDGVDLGGWQQSGEN